MGPVRVCIVRFFHFSDGDPWGDSDNQMLRTGYHDERMMVPIRCDDNRLTINDARYSLMSSSMTRSMMCSFCLQRMPRCFDTVM